MRADGAAHVCLRMQGSGTPAGTALQSPSHHSHRHLCPVPQFPPLQIPRGRAPGTLRTTSPELPHAEVDDGDDDCWRGWVVSAWELQHSSNFHRAIPAAGWDAQLLARSGSRSQRPRPSPAHGGCRPRGDTDPREEVTTRSSRLLPVTASPGMALPEVPEPPAPQVSAPGEGGGLRMGGGGEQSHPIRTGRQKGGRGPAAARECPLPSAPFPRIRLPSSQATRARHGFPGAGIPAPRGAGGEGRGPPRGPLPSLGAGRWWESGGEERGEGEAALGARWGMHPQSSTGNRELHPQSSAGGRGLHPDSRSPAPRRGYSGQCPRRQHCRRAQGARDAKRDQRGREMLPAHSSLPAGRRVAGTCPESGETSRDGSGGAEGGNLKTEQQPRGWGRSLALLLL